MGNKKLKEYAFAEGTQQVVSGNSRMKVERYFRSSNSTKRNMSNVLSVKDLLSNDGKHRLFRMIM